MRGSILVNGNIRDETDFVRLVRDRLLTSCHDVPAVRESRKVLIVTAGWVENEYQEDHLKQAISEVGIPSRFVDGYDVNVQNLAVWHAREEFFAKEPELAEHWHARSRLVEAARSLYLEKNSFYVALLRRSLERIRELFPGLPLARVMTDVTRAYPHPPADYDGERLLGYFVGKDICSTVQRLIENDDALVELLRDLDEHFAAGTGLHHSRTWRAIRATLEARILSANSIFILGGDLRALHGSLHFFRLREAFMEALRRGTCIYAVSAGSLLLCERIIVYNDFASDVGPRREFQLFDRGFGLVRHVQIFPHCMDRIQTDDSDNLCYLAYRFQNRTCVGLNEDSFLLLEAEPRVLARSVGSSDGVYVFDATGTKTRYDGGQEIQELAIE